MTVRFFSVLLFIYVFYDVSHGPPGGDQEVRDAGDQGVGGYGARGKSPLQQAQLCPGQEDEAQRVLLPATCGAHGCWPDAIVATRYSGRSDRRTNGEAVQSLPQEQPGTHGSLLNCLLNKL